jgi:hypothetical protein
MARRRKDLIEWGTEPTDERPELVLVDAEAPADDAPPHDDDDCPDDVVRVAKLSGQPVAPRFPLFTDLELAALPAKAAVVAGMLFADTLASIVAKWESFKTFFALEVAFCIAVGADYNGRRVQHGAVVYVSAEGGASIAKRLAALRAKYGAFQGQIPLLIHPGPVLINQPEQVAALLESTRSRLADLGWASLSIVAVFIDTLARNMSGNENAVEDMSAFRRGLDYIRTETGACVIVVHHTGWEGERSRGSSSLPSALDTEIFIRRDDQQIVIHNEKQKDAPHFPDFTLEATPMAGSLVFLPVVPGSPKLTANETIALKQVQEAPGLRSNPWLEASGLPKGSFHNARKRLIALAYVGQRGGVYLATDAGRLALGTTVKCGTSEVQP